MPTVTINGAALHVGGRHWLRNHLGFPRVGSGSAAAVVVLRKCRDVSGEETNYQGVSHLLGWKVAANRVGCNL